MKIRGCFDELSAEVSSDVSVHREARVRGKKEGNSVWMGSDEVGHGSIVVCLIHCLLDGSGAWSNNSEILNFTTCCRRSLFIFLSAVPRAELRLSQAGVMVRRRASRSDLEGGGGSEGWSAPVELFLRMACVRRMERWSALMVWEVRR